MSTFPARHRLNHLFQKHVTGSGVLSNAGFDGKVDQCRRHLAHYSGIMGVSAPPSLALELGTGWYPIVPVGLALAGVKQVITIDVAPLVEIERTRRVLALYASRLKSERPLTLLPAVSPERAAKLIAVAADETTQDPKELLRRLGVRVLVGDARMSRLPSGSVELFVSNNTFEHIRPAVLCEIMTEFGRLAAPGAVMDHLIDMSDHYAHFDHSITEFNCMRYSERAWRLFNNKLQYQSRLRASDYHRIIEKAGFRIIMEEAERGAPEDLDRVRLSRTFSSYTTEDLLILRSWMTAVPAA